MEQEPTIELDVSEYVHDDMVRVSILLVLVGLAVQFSPSWLVNTPNRVYLFWYIPSVYICAASVINFVLTLYVYRKQKFMFVGVITNVLFACFWGLTALIPVLFDDAGNVLALLTWGFVAYTVIRSKLRGCL